MSCRLLADALQRGRRYHADAAVTAGEALDALRSASYHLVLIGTNFPEQPLGGFRLIRHIQELSPGISMVVLLDALDRNVVIEAFRSGARGIFCRSDSFQALCKCIQCVHEGQVWASSQELQFVLEALVQPG